MTMYKARYYKADGKKGKARALPDTLFDGVYGSEMDGTRVEKADLIAYALAEERLAPDRVLMIGDRQHDMIGARRCGVRAIGVSYGYGSEAELRAHGAEAIAPAPAAIPALVTALLA